MKRILSAVLAALMIIVLAGCGTKFDASGYVQSMLDTWYKGDYEKYMELTGATQAEAEEAHKSNLDVESDFFANYFYIEHMSDETKQKIMDMYELIYDKAKYEVKEANETKEGGFTVEVLIYPINIMTLIEDDYNAYLDEFNTKAQNGEYDDLSDEMYEEQFTSGLLDIINKHIPNIDYEEPKSRIVQVKEDENEKNVYFVSDDEMSSIDEYIISY